MEVHHRSLILNAVVHETKLDENLLRLYSPRGHLVHWRLIRLVGGCLGFVDGAVKQR